MQTKLPTLNVPKNLILMGTMHINTVTEMEQTIEERFQNKQNVPNLIGIELDETRFNHALKRKALPESLRQKTTVMPDPSAANPEPVSGLARLVSSAMMFAGAIVQSIPARLRGTRAGTDQMFMAELALLEGKQLFLMDKDVKYFGPRIGQAILNGIRNIMTGAVTTTSPESTPTPTPAARSTDHITFSDPKHLKHFQNIEKLTTYIQSRNFFPNSILVEERNAHMASNTIKVLAENPDPSMVMVVGAAHVPGLIDILSRQPNLNLEVMFSEGMEEFYSQVLGAETTPSRRSRIEQKKIY